MLVRCRCVRFKRILFAFFKYKRAYAVTYLMLSLLTITGAWYATSKRSTITTHNTSRTPRDQRLCSNWSNVRTSLERAGSSLSWQRLPAGDGYVTSAYYDTRTRLGRVRVIGITRSDVTFTSRLFCQLWYDDDDSETRPFAVRATTDVTPETHDRR